MTKQAQVVISLSQWNSSSVLPGLFTGLCENNSSCECAVPTGGTRGERQHRREATH